MAADNTKPGFMRAAPNLNGPFYVTLQLHQTSSNLCKKGRKANFISTILLHGMKRHCWPLYQNCRMKVRFLCGLCHHEDPGCEEFPQVTNMKDRAGKSARIPPNDRQDERSFNAYVIVPPSKDESILFLQIQDRNVDDEDGDLPFAFDPQGFLCHKLTK